MIVVYSTTNKEQSGIVSVMNKKKKDNIVRKIFYLFWEFVDFISSKENVDDELRVRKPAKFLKIVSSNAKRKAPNLLESTQIEQFKSGVSSTDHQKATGTF